MQSQSVAGLVNCNSDGMATGQSVEAGWMVSSYQYGDNAPHLFTWYTTKGWNTGPGVGGYDSSVTGWVQYDDTIYPGAVMTHVSSPGGEQASMPLKFGLFEGNWWLMVGGRWIGYYPGTLFSDARAGQSLADSANRILCGEEVFSSNADPTATTTQMGSGAWPEARIGKACFMEYLKVQSDMTGTMVDLHGATLVQEDAKLFKGSTESVPNSPCGSYLLAGGPGAA